MVDHPMDTPYTNDGEPFTAPGSVPTEQFSPVTFQSNSLSGEMSLAVLVAHCVRELNTYRKGEPCTERYVVELIHRATVQGDQEAWACVQHCFGSVVLDWILHHSQRVAACRLKSEEYYVAQAFERFWQATASHQRVECNTLAAALHSLRVSLQGAILDTLRVYERSWETSVSEPGEPREPRVVDETSSSEVWEVLQTMLPDRREHRLAYLLFHCGLKPPEIVRFCQMEWSDVHEIYRLRHTIMQRFLNNADHLR